MTLIDKSVTLKYLWLILNEILFIFSTKEYTIFQTLLWILCLEVENFHDPVYASFKTFILS